jgi:hypothetical protein
MNMSYCPKTDILKLIMVIDKADYTETSMPYETYKEFKKKYK